MFAKTINYLNFNEEEETGVFYFHLSEAELLEMQLRAINGDETETYEGKMQQIVDEKNGNKIIDHFKALIKLSYGKKSPDGKKFIKNDEIFNDFASTGAYGALFTELATNAEAAAEFSNKLISKKELENAKKRAADIRAKSEANMQGFNKKQDTPKVETVTELPAAAPVLDQSGSESGPVEVTVTTGPVGTELDEFMAWKRAQAAQTNG